jgi:hypothetical protein
VAAGWLVGAGGTPRAAAVGWAASNAGTQQTAAPHYDTVVESEFAALLPSPPCPAPGPLQEHQDVSQR